MTGWRHQVAIAWDNFIRLETRRDRKLAASLFVSALYLGAWIGYRLAS